MTTYRTGSQTHVSMLRYLTTLLVSGLGAGAVLVLGLNLQRLRWAAPGQFDHLFVSANYGSADVVAGTLVIGLLMALAYSWAGQGLRRNSIVTGLEYGVIIWLVQSLYIGLRQAFFLVHLPLSAVLIALGLWLPWNLSTGLVISLLYRRLEGQLTGTQRVQPKRETSARSSKLFVSVKVVLSGLIAGAISQSAWLLFMSPYDWFRRIVIQLGSSSEIFITVFNANTLTTPLGIFVTVLLVIPLTLGYAILRPGLGAVFWDRVLRYSWTIYVLRYLFREWAGDYALLHQPLTLTPFFLVVNFIEALIEGAAIVGIYDKVWPCLMTKVAPESCSREIIQVDSRHV